MGKSFKDMTKEELQEAGKKGGVKSGKTRAAKKQMKDALETILSMSLHKGAVVNIDKIKNIADIKGKNITVQDAVLIAQVQKALKEAIENLDEAKKLEKMTAEQRAKYQFDKEKAAFDAEKKAFERQQLVLATGKELIKRGLDASFADVLTGDTAEETAAKIDKFEETFRNAVSNSISNKMRGTAPRDKTQGTTITMDSIKSMSVEEINAHWDEVQNVLKQNK